MKQMEYGKALNDRAEVLYHGVIDGFECAIVNTAGHHPCAYINVPADVLKKYDNPELDYDKWSSYCHGGFTYAAKDAPGIDGDPGFWLGWDYAHYGDYSCYIIDGIDRSLGRGRRWTTVEVLENVVDTIHSLEYLG